MAISSPASSALRAWPGRARTLGLMPPNRTVPNPMPVTPQPTTCRASVRVFNFSPGPAVLPLEVLEQARDELLDWHGTGTSVMELSHRGKAFTSIARQAEPR